MKTSSRTKGFSSITAGVSLAIASVVVVLALPQVSPTMRARQLDKSAQEVANFLEQARTASVERNAPVACRVEIDGSRTVLSLDWSFNGAKAHSASERLVLDRGLVLTQGGVPQKSGMIAVFNPRGGAVIGSVRVGSGKPAELSLSQRGGPASELREISLTSAGDFAVTGGSPKA